MESAGSTPKGCDEASTKRFLGYSAQVLVSHVLGSVVDEMVFRKEGFAFPSVFGATEFATFALVPLLLQGLRGGYKAILALLFSSSSGASSKDEAVRFALCGAAMAVSHGSGLAAFVYVNYTTAMLFSSARLPSILIVSSLLRSKSCHTPAPPCMAHIAGLVVAFGLVVFGLAEKRDTPRFSAIGLLCVFANLALGAGTFYLQQRTLHWVKASGKERDLRSTAADKRTLRPVATERLMVIQYVIACSCMFTYSFVSGELAGFQRWACSDGHRGVLNELVPMVCSAFFISVGVRALLQVSMEFDAARASLITSVRKVVTFVLSFAIFPKALSLLHVLGLLLVAVGSVATHRSLTRSRAKITSNPRLPTIVVVDPTQETDFP